MKRKNGIVVFVVLVSMLLCGVLLTGCGGKKHVGTWYHIYDGSDTNNGYPRYNSDGSYAIGFLTLNKDGTFSLKEVDKYSTYTYEVTKWRTRDGSYSIEKDEITFTYSNKEIEDMTRKFMINKDGKTGKLGNWYIYKEK